MWQVGVEMFDGQERFGGTDIAGCSFSSKGKEKTPLTSFLLNTLASNSGKLSTLRRNTEKGWHPDF